jgi:hypothetical protein
MPRVNRKDKKNGSRVKTKTGYTYVVYCKDCPPKAVSDPQNDVRVVVDGTNTPSTVRCPEGHVTKVVL